LCLSYHSTKIKHTLLLVIQIFTATWCPAEKENEEGALSRHLSPFPPFFL